MPALTIAVPRGALLGETLDLLDTLGIDTAEVRANDRKLLFEDAGLVTTVSYTHLTLPTN